MSKQEIIVSAACKDPVTGVVFSGARHFDEIMISQMVACNHSTEAYIQGFITNESKFVDRKEAWDIANAANQIKYRVAGDVDVNGVGKLFDGNLY